MVIFGAGVVTGRLLVQHATRVNDRRGPLRIPGALRPGQPTSPAGIARFDFLRRMERELDLTPEQREPAEKVLKEGQERMRKLNDTIEPRRRQELRRTMDEFRHVLTPEQLARFDQLLKQAQQQRQREQRKQTAPREPGATNTVPGSSPPGTNS